MARMEHVTSRRVLRDPKSNYSIIYDPQQTELSNSNHSQSYNGCLRRIEKSYEEGVIDQSGKQFLITSITEVWKHYRAFRNLTDRDDLP